MKYPIFIDVAMAAYHGDPTAKLLIAACALEVTFGHARDQAEAFDFIRDQVDQMDRTGEFQR
jgi:hypothetical protein